MNGSQFFLTFALLAGGECFAVAPASPASCRSVTRSKLGEHLRETVWEITHARAKLNHALLDHSQRCQKARGDLIETRQLSEIERVAAEARKINAELLDLEDEYLRTAQVASEAAHLLGEDDCQERIVEERHRMEHEMDAKNKQVGAMLELYCR